MKPKKDISRRNFVKTGIFSSAAIAGAASIVSCSGNDHQWKREAEFPVFMGNGFNPEEGVAGLLFSQLGYEIGLPVRIIVRLPEKEQLPENAECLLYPSAGEEKYRTDCKYWGSLWGSHWWVAEFPAINETGEWAVEIQSGSQILFRDSGLVVGENILWDSTIEWSSVDMLERRKHFTKVGGWQDAGTLWVESPAQSAMVISLEELLERTPDRFTDEFTKRIYTQIILGCKYLVKTQDKARALGYAPGAMSHDLLGHEKDILPHDVMKAVIALAKASVLLPDAYVSEKEQYRKAADLSFTWLLKKAKPMGDYGFARIQRGLSEDAVIPGDEFPTRDLLKMCWVALEMNKLGYPDAKNIATDYARKVMDRQRQEDDAESGFFGHFYEFSSMSHSEPSWIHGIVGSDFGTDIGGIYPNYLMPLIDLLKQYPEHEDAKDWKACLHKFTTGYFIPACKANPFFLIPQGIFGDEGPVWFCGTFHGTNAIYGYSAALALELHTIFGEAVLKDIAYGNLQWLAGLNAGITKANVRQGCVVFSTDIPEGAALPASMICGIGRRWAGTWFQTRGVICNGFSTGTQFVHDVAPTKKNDGPFSLTDEDWIPHSAAWLTGLMRLK